MNSGYRYFFYALIALMAAAAVSFLVFQDQALESRSPSGDLGAWASSLAVTAAPVPSDEIFKASTFTGLTDYSPSFDFNKVCVSGKCAAGNSQPFRIPPPPEEKKDGEVTN